jgi:hypothetical protein
VTWRQSESQHPPLAGPERVNVAGCPHCEANVSIQAPKSQQASRPTASPYSLTGVLPNVFKVAEPRLRTSFIQYDSTQLHALLHSDPCRLSGGIVGQSLMSCPVSLRALPNVPNHSLMRPPNTSSSSHALHDLRLGVWSNCISIPRPRFEHELDSLVSSLCPLNILGSVDNIPNEKPKE